MSLVPVPSAAGLGLSAVGAALRRDGAMRGGAIAAGTVLLGKIQTVASERSINCCQRSLTSARVARREIV